MGGTKRAAEGPGTRSRGKKSRNATVDTTQIIHRRIATTGIISAEDRARLFHLEKPVCQGCRTNTKDNPNCFCALIPPSNGVRKQGLWQKVPEAVLQLGTDPALNLRQSSDPIGLTNLGATCYVNSVLQCLFMIPSFREALYSVEPELLQRSPVLYQLARLFVELQTGKKNFVDPSVFACTLQLDNSVQQDGQEFMKLLLGRLEMDLAKARSPRAKNLVQEMFGGTQSYVTRCSQCGQESESSQQVEGFYELVLNVKGFPGLLESLEDYVSEEKLEGDNRYSCEYCQTRTDATRCLKLRSLPPVVNIQLKRFVFNVKTSTKKKVTSRFAFPQTLHLGPHIVASQSHKQTAEGEPSSQLSNGCHLKQEAPPGPGVEGRSYDLTAILVHKGSLATSGHYVAHIRNEQTGQWWQFDDDVVTCLGDHPLGITSSNESPPAGAENGSVTAGSDGGEGEVEMAEMRPVEGSGSRSPDGIERDPPSPSHEDAVVSKEKQDPSMLTSADAYMLMYTRRRLGQEGQEGEQAGERNAGASLATCREDGTEPSREDREGSSPPVPEHLLKEVEDKNAQFDAACQRFTEVRAEETLKNTERRKEVRRILADAPVAQTSDPCYWIATQWLRSWADDPRPPGEIDNTGLLCAHDKFPPRKVAMAKRISDVAWTSLVSLYGGGPSLDRNQCCSECVREDASNAISADHFRDERNVIRQQLEDILANRGLEGNLYYVSKSWVTFWLRRKNVEGVCEADAGPTASLRCPHGELLPEDTPGARRQLVTEQVWDYVSRLAAEVPGADPLGYLAFPANSPECAICQVDMSSEASKQEGLRASKVEQKQRHEALFAGRPVPLLPSQQYNLVPQSWLVQWRAYLAATAGKNVASVEPPGNLGEAIAAACCSKHHCLLWRPPELVLRRNELCQKTVQGATAFTVVREADWEGLCEEWGGDPKTGIVALLGGGATSPAEAAGPLTKAPRVARKGSSKKEAREALGTPWASRQEEGGAAVAGEGFTEQAEAVGCSSIIDLTETSGSEGVKLDAHEQPFLVTQPEVCLECIAERESVERARRLDYSNGEITVELAKGKEPPPSMVAASGGAHEGERRSRRARKASVLTGGRAVLKVAGDTTVHALKLQIWEALNVVRENQRLGCGELELTDDNARLADCNILPESRLWVVDTGQHEHRDIAEDLPMEDAIFAETEEGFKGTGLLGGAMLAFPDCRQDPDVALGEHAGSPVRQEVNHVFREGQTQGNGHAMAYNGPSTDEEFLSTPSLLTNCGIPSSNREEDGKENGRHPPKGGFIGHEQMEDGRLDRDKCGSWPGVSEGQSALDGSGDGVGGRTEDRGVALKLSVGEP